MSEKYTLSINNENVKVIDAARKMKIINLDSVGIKLDQMWMLNVSEIGCPGIRKDQQT